MTDTGAKNVGLDFNNANSQIGVATFTTGDFTSSGFATNHALSSASLQAALYAQVQSGRGRIVSKPRIAAQSGSTAKIITGDALPIQTAITLSRSQRGFATGAIRCQCRCDAANCAAGQLRTDS